MAKPIYINLPVRDLQSSIAFFTQLGFDFDPQCSDDNAVCMIVDDNIFVMLLVEAFFQTFTPKPVCDARQSTEVLLCLALASRDEVDAMVAAALAAGGSAPLPARDHGFMYGHGFQDLDGHLWELIYMSAPAAELTH